MRGMQGPMLITEQKNKKYTNLKRMNPKFRTNHKHTQDTETRGNTHKRVEEEEMHLLLLSV